MFSSNISNSPKKLTASKRKRIFAESNHVDEIKTSDIVTVVNDEPQRKLLKSRSELSIASYGEGPFFFREHAYEMLNHHLNFLTNSLIVSKGFKNSSGNDTRECIYLNMNSTVLYSYFQKFVNGLHEANIDSQELTPREDDITVPDVETILSQTSPTELFKPILNYVNSVFHKPYSEEKIAALKSSDNSLTFETILENGMGSCRHKSLLTAYLLATAIHTMQKEQLNNDAVYLVRHYVSKIIDGKTRMFSHAGICYLHQDKKYFLEANFKDHNNEYLWFEFTNDQNLFSTVNNYYKPYSFNLFWDKLQNISCVAPEEKSLDYSPITRAP